MRLDWERSADLQAKGLSQRLKGLSRSSGADWQRAGAPGETVTEMIVRAHRQEESAPAEVVALN